MSKPITVRAIEATRRAVDRGGQPTAIRDGRTPGLALTVGKRTARWWLEYKVPLAGGGWSHGRRLLLGEFDDLSIDAAREAARVAKRQVAEGLDPAAARRARRRANVEASATRTVSAAIARYVDERSQDWTTGTRNHFRSDFARIRAALGDAPLALVERSALIELINTFLADQRRRGNVGVTQAIRIAQLIAALWRQAGPGSRGAPGGTGLGSIQPSLPSFRSLAATGSRRAAGCCPRPRSEPFGQCCVTGCRVYQSALCRGSCWR